MTQLLRLDSIDRWLAREREDALAGSNDENAPTYLPTSRATGKLRSLDAADAAPITSSTPGRASTLSRTDSVTSCEMDGTEVVEEPACAGPVEAVEASEVAPVVLERSERRRPVTLYIATASALALIILAQRWSASIPFLSFLLSITALLISAILSPA